jgi:1-acyl-sn-glycerol-3-phosphate acyltransferase
MFRAIRYVLTNAVLTSLASARVVWTALTRKDSARTTQIFNDIPRRWGLSMLRRTSIVVDVDGVDRIPEGPVVFVANHASWADIWVVLAGIPRPVRFVFKKELGRIPLLGRALRNAGHFEIDRANRGAAFAVYDRAAEQIRTSGLSAMVFAEGTRSRNGRMMPFKKGPFVLAIRAQVPVVPVAIIGTYDRLPPGSVNPVPGLVRLRFGLPIPTTGLDYDSRDAIAEQARAAMLELGAPA